MVHADYIRLNMVAKRRTSMYLLDIENISVLKQKKQKQSTQNDFYYAGSSLEYFCFYHIDICTKMKKLNSINSKYTT